MRCSEEKLSLVHLNKEEVLIALSEGQSGAKMQMIKRTDIAISFILVLMGLVLLPALSHSGEAEGILILVQGVTVSEEVSTYSSFIEKYVNQHWKKGDRPDSRFQVTLLEVTKRERVEQLKGQYNYCLVMIEFAREVRECMACFWQPDVPGQAGKAFEFKGIYEVARKPIV